MPASPFLQSVIAPVCRFRQTSQGAIIEQLHGTAFLISNDGAFLTARHVIEQGLAATEKDSQRLGIFPMQPVAGVPTSLTIPILSHEFAPEPCDVAVCTTAYQARTFFRVTTRAVEVWQDIATAGYPASAIGQASPQYQVQQRAHKGYIQRCVPTGRLPVGRHPDVFEVSFPITQGLSGAPLFIHEADYEAVIGVCVGSLTSRVVAYEETMRVEGTTEGKVDQVRRVEEFGIAHDLRALAGWAPKCFGGTTLLEFSERNWSAG